jgi:uncharacterized membrane protein
MTHPLVKVAVAGALSAGVVGLVTAAPEPAPTYKAEKCYAIAKAGKNDCQTNTSACAGTSKRDNQTDAWIYVPAGSCSKIVGGSLKKA